MSGPAGIADMASFWIDGDSDHCDPGAGGLSTNQLTVVNGHVHDSQCFTLGKKRVF